MWEGTIHTWQATITSLPVFVMCIHESAQDEGYRGDGRGVHRAWLAQCTGTQCLLSRRDRGGASRRLVYRPLRELPAALYSHAPHGGAGVRRVAQGLPEGPQFWSSVGGDEFRLKTKRHR